MSKILKDLSPELEAVLTREAARLGKTMEEFLSEAVSYYLDELEDIELAKKDWAELEQNAAKNYPLDEVVKELGINGIQSNSQP